VGMNSERISLECRDGLLCGPSVCRLMIDQHNRDEVLSIDYLGDIQQTIFERHATDKKLYLVGITFLSIFHINKMIRIL